MQYVNKKRGELDIEYLWIRDYEGGEIEKIMV